MSRTSFRGFRFRRPMERYRILFEHSPLSITLFDPASLRILEANETALQLYGYTREELLARTMLDLKVPEETPELIDGMVPVLDGGGVVGEGARRWRGTRTHRRKDGTHVDVEINAHRVIVGGRPIMLAIGNDVTETRRLERHVQEAQKMDAIGNLAGGIAHDFNNLLSVILSYSDMLAQDLAPDDPKREDIEQIRDAGKRAADLTRQLLTISRQHVVTPAIVDLNDVVAGLEKMLRRLIGEDIELSACPAGAIANVKADRGQIEQVIMNLVVNARDAMPGGGKLTIGTADVFIKECDAAEYVGLKPGPHVLLLVSDTGVGIDRATQARMFEPFFTTKEVGKGTGLGLATVFGIVRQSAGTICVQSEPGKGTTIKVYLPATERGALDVPMPSSPTDSRTVVHGSETILLVEDEDSVRILTRTILGKRGYNVLEAQGPGDAFLLCEQFKGRIDLLLTDVVMPLMGGRQLATRLLTIRPQMKVLYMSGHTTDAVVRQGILEATVAFLQKPITPDVLALKVREVLHPRPAVSSMCS
jgi:two-component system, cell cycle sensor histidine kinase and response regulator CckA